MDINDNNKTLNESVKSLAKSIEIMKRELELQKNVIYLHEINLIQLGVTIDKKNTEINKHINIIEKYKLTISNQNEMIENHKIAIDERCVNIKDIDEIDRNSNAIAKLSIELSKVINSDNFECVSNVKRLVNELRTSRRYTVIEAIRQKFKKQR